jgi:ABC-2 type transport system permease protein
MTTYNISINYASNHLGGYVAKLLHLRQVTLVSGFKRSKPLIKALDIGLVLLTVGVAIGSYLLCKAILNELSSPLLIQSGIDLASLMDAVPPFILVVVFILTMMASFRILLQALYLAKDMDFLVSAPIPIRAVFLTKLLEALLPGFILVLVFGLPALISIGVTQGYNIVYFPLLPLVLIFLSLAAAGLSSLLVMVIVRIFPAKRVAEVLTFMGAFFIILLSQSFNLMGDKLENLTQDQIASGASLFTKLNKVWYPLGWGGRSLVDIGQGEWLSGVIFLALTLVLSSLIFWITLSTAERLYYTGWASLQVGTTRKKNHRIIHRQETGGMRKNLIRRGLSTQIGAIITKDFKLIRRDLNNLSQIIGALIMGVVFGVMLLRAGGKPIIGQSDSPKQLMEILRSAKVYGSMVIGLFVGWCMVARLALVAFSMEGMAYWILKAAPVNAGKLLTAKFWMAYIPSLFLGWFYLIGIAILQKPPLATILYGLPSIALILAGLCGINLAFGVQGVNLTWTNPRKMENGVASLFGTILSIVYQLITLLIFFGPPLVFPLIGITEEVGMAVGLVAGCVVTSISTFLPLKMIKNRVVTIGEE